jgi:hypothetical protein
VAQAVAQAVVNTLPPAMLSAICRGRNSDWDEPDEKNLQLLVPR